MTERCNHEWGEPIRFCEPALRECSKCGQVQHAAYRAGEFVGWEDGGLGSDQE